MRRISKKRAAFNKEANAWRAAFKGEIGRCEYCLKKAAVEHLELHEISRGYARKNSLDKPAVILCLHRHCHRLVEQWPRPRQLCLVMARRPNDYNLSIYNSLVTRRVYQEEVDGFFGEVDAVQNRPDGK